MDAMTRLELRLGEWNTAKNLDSKIENQSTSDGLILTSQCN